MEKNIKDRRIQWDLSLDEVGLIICGLDQIGKEWPQDVRDDAERLVERIENEFPEVPYVLDPEGFFEKVEDEEKVIAWAWTLPTSRNPDTKFSPFPVEL